MGESSGLYNPEEVKPQIKELCMLMLDILNKGWRIGVITKEEYRKHIKCKKEFLHK